MLTFRDVSIEEIAHSDLEVPKTVSDSAGSAALERHRELRAVGPILEPRQGAPLSISHLSVIPQRPYIAFPQISASPHDSSPAYRMLP